MEDFFLKLYAMLTQLLSGKTAMATLRWQVRQSGTKKNESRRSREGTPFAVQLPPSRKWT